MWHYQVIVARLVFFVVFEHIVFVCKFAAVWLIKDEPRPIKRLARVQSYVSFLFQRICPFCFEAAVADALLCLLAGRVCLMEMSSAVLLKVLHIFRRSRI